MSPDEERLCDALASVCELASNTAIETYKVTIDALRDSDSEDVLRCMLRCLRDTDAGEVQYELVEASEAFPDYVRVFLYEGLGVHEKAPKWFRLMFQSILNTPDDAAQAIAHINQLPSESRAAYKRILSRIADETPQYLGILERLK